MRTVTNRVAPTILVAVMILALTAPSASSQHASRTQEAYPSLRELLDEHFSVGAAVKSQHLTGPERDLLEHHVSSLTAEFEMKWQFIQPEEGVWDWAATDELVAFANEHDIAIRGHTLIWHQSIPDWVFQDEDGAPLTDSPDHQDLLLDRMETHITTVMERYADEILVWDVVNEAVDETQPDNLRRTRWYEVLGQEYLGHAFEIARAANPEATLYYNDFSTEFTSRRLAVFDLLDQLIDDGVPIDGIGHQMHLTRFTDQGGIADALDLFGALGLEQAITELDVAVHARCFPEDDCDPPTEVTPAQLQAQAIYYRDLFELFSGYDDVVNVTTWGIHDGESWLQTWPQPQVEAPLLFDEELQPKPAYFAIVDAFTDGEPPAGPCGPVVVSTSFDDGSPQGWRAAGNTGLVVTSDVVARRGGFSLLVGDRPAFSDGASLDLTAGVVPGSSYVVEVWLRVADGQGPAVLQITSITTLDDEREFSWLGSIEVGDDDWHLMEVEIEIPDDVQTYELKLEGAAGVDFHVDDVAVIDPGMIGVELDRDDEFEGDELDLCLWDMIVGHNPGDYWVEGGRLWVNTTDGGNVGDTNAPQIENQFLQSIDPDEDWLIETSVEAPVQHQWQQAGLQYYQDDANYVKVDVAAENPPGGGVVHRVEFVSEIDDDPTHVMLEDVPDNPDDQWWVRLQKEGDLFTAWVSVDGEEWIELGGPLVNDAISQGGIGLQQQGRTQLEPVTVGFDYFAFDPDDEQPTEPGVVEASLDPRHPDGDDDWYVSPVRLVLASDDADAQLVWRQAGDEDWVEWTPPVVFDDDGHHTIEYLTGHDDGDDTEAGIGVMSFQVDQTPPVTVVSLEGETDGDAYLDEVLVTLQASDATSGVAETWYRIGGGDERAYDGAFTVAGDGARVVEYRSQDVAGNVGDWQSVAFDIGDGGSVEPPPPPPPPGDVCARHQGGASFPDVPGSGHGFFIDCLAVLGIVEGMTDGLFRPGDDVSRGQLASFVVRAIETATGETLATGASSFPDVGMGSTHGQAIHKLRHAGVVRGFEDGTFRPGESVSRDQTARYVVNALEHVLGASLVTSGVRFPDVTAGQYVVDIDKLATAGVIGGFADATFGPRSQVTRGQMTRFIGNGLEVLAAEDAYRGP